MRSWLPALLLLAAAPVSAAILDERLAALASRGNAEAAYHLGMLYNNGIGVAQNPSAAFRWFGKAADGGDALGAYKVGCYYDGQGETVIAPDAEKALAYKLVAAKAGYSLAQQDVALHYFRAGKIKEANQWLDAAAAQGETTSLIAIVRIEAASDPVRAYIALGKITKLAGEGENGVALLAQFRARLTPAQVKAADTAIQAYSPAQTPLTLKARGGLAVARTLANLPND